MADHRLSCVEAFPQALPDALAGEPNPVQRQKPFDTPNDADACFDEVLSLTLDAFCIFLLDARNLNVMRRLAISRQPHAQCASHAFSIDPISLGPAATARH